MPRTVPRVLACLLVAALVSVASASRTEGGAFNSSDWDRFFAEGPGPTYEPNISMAIGFKASG